MSIADRFDPLRVRKAPLRLVARHEVIGGRVYDVLECGHTTPQPSGEVDPRPLRRRCVACLNHRDPHNLLAGTSKRS